MSQVINIGPQQRLSRKVIGIIFVSVGVVAGIVVLSNNLPVIWYLATFVLVYTGVLAYLESQYGVCPLNAMQGKQSMTGYVSFGQEKVDDPTKVKAARRVALKQIWQSLAISLVLSVILIGITIIAL